MDSSSQTSLKSPFIDTNLAAKVAKETRADFLSSDLSALWTLTRK